MKIHPFLVLLLACSIGTGIGCSKKEEGNAGSNLPLTTQLGTASVTGRVTLTGKPPVMEPINFAGDPVCKAQHVSPVKDQMVEVNDHGQLADVFVYVASGAGNYPPPTTPVTLEQKGCLYTPHVFGIQVGQALEIVNDDATLHNVHNMAVTNDGFNVAQPVQGMVTEKKFDKPEVPVYFKCDVHAWMHCMAGVISNPFFSISDQGGGYRISRLPAGTYVLVACQEKYGASQPQTVTLQDGESKKINFTFAAQ